MIVATNTIKIQSGHVDEVAERFKNPKGVHEAPGFIRMELLKSVEAEYDELKVCTTWESREAFDGWVNSDAFKQAHGRPAGAQGQAGHPGGAPGANGASHPGASGAQARSVMLGAKLSVHEVLFTL